MNSKSLVQSTTSNLENRIGVLYLDSSTKSEYPETNFLLPIIRLVRKMFLWKLWLVFAIFTSSNHIGVQVTQKIVVRLSKIRPIQICNTSYQKLLVNGLLKSTDKFCPVSVHDHLLMCIQKNFVVITFFLP